VSCADGVSLRGASAADGPFRLRRKGGAKDALSGSPAVTRRPHGRRRTDGRATAFLMPRHGFALRASPATWFSLRLHPTTRVTPARTGIPAFESLFSASRRGNSLRLSLRAQRKTPKERASSPAVTRRPHGRRRTDGRAASFLMPRHGFALRASPATWFSLRFHQLTGSVQPHQRASHFHAYHADGSAIPCFRPRGAARLNADAQQRREVCARRGRRDESAGSAARRALAPALQKSLFFAPLSFPRKESGNTPRDSAERPCASRNGASARRTLRQQPRSAPARNSPAQQRALRSSQRRSSSRPWRCIRPPARTSRPAAIQKAAVQPRVCLMSRPSSGPSSPRKPVRVTWMPW